LAESRRRSRSAAVKSDQLELGRVGWACYASRTWLARPFSAAAVRAKSRPRTCRLAEESRKWRPARRNKMTLETGSTAVCDRCRRDFSPRRRDTRFCSAACKQAAYRLRLEAAEEEARRAAEAARKAAEAAAEVTRRAIDLAHALIG
jgi:hypothetical protein